MSIFGYKGPVAIPQLRHRWRSNSDMCYTSYPPQYDFICKDCREEVTTSVEGLSKAECPARVEAGRRRVMV